MSRLYERWCKKVNSKIGASREELEERRESKKDKYLQTGKELRKAERKLREKQIIYGEESDEYKDALKELQKIEKSHRSAEREYKRDEFAKTAYFTGMDIEYEEVLLFSVFLTILSFFILVTGFVGLNFIQPIGLFEILTYVIPALLIIPMAVLVFTANYPEILEKRLKASTIGKAPESINYMTMSMRVRPSLYRAISFSAKNTEEPMASGLNKVLWDVHTRKKSSLEESFLDFALDWGEWNEELKRSLYAVRSAILEKTTHGLHSALEKANQIIIEGTQRKVEDFANSLSTPTTILFAIGILLPLIIGAMLPMMALGGLDISSMNSSEGAQQSPLGLIHIILLMDIVSPLGAFIYSYKILGDRPGTVSPPKVSCEKGGKKGLIGGVLIGVVSTVLAFYFSPFLAVVSPLQYFWGPIIGVSFYCLSTTSEQKRERKDIIEMEKEFPDSLFQMGSRIAEGMPPEKAIQKTSQTMKGTKIGELFKRISLSQQVDRLPLKDSLFGKDGILTDFPSRTIKATMKTVVELTRKDPKEAGQTILQISQYLRDMEEMDHEIKSRLSQSVGMMKGTAMVFAPIVMGVVSSLYFMLEDIFSDITNIQMISPTAFTGVLAVYLVLMSVVITYFTTGIENQMDLVEFKYDVGTILLVNISVFSLAVVAGKVGIVG